MFNAYSPACMNINPNTEIKYVNENTINVDGLDYEFDSNSIQFPNINVDTQGVIISAIRDTELHLTVRRFYSNDCSTWDTGMESDFVSVPIETNVSETSDNTNTVDVQVEVV